LTMSRRGYIITRDMNQLIDNLYTLRRLRRRPSRGSGGGSLVSG
jgi:hypothetical protein